MFRPFTKWPILLGAALCLGLGAVLIRDVPSGNIVTGLILVTIGALMLGVFIALYVVDVVVRAREPPPPGGDGGPT